ncbi:MAG: ATP-binding cassette domain-containing protein [Actinomycetota bacterium]|nr:ATP-binding cassette domain-containing protein [Actinomycetota bacterium]
MTNAQLLELSAVSKAYPRRSSLGRHPTLVPAVEQVTLTLARGEILGLVGESGAGKSTLTRLILGLEQPDAGQIALDGVRLSDLSRGALRAVRRRMHLILQDPYQSLHPGMRVGRAVAEPLAIAGLPPASRTARVVPALEEVGLVPGPDFLGRFPHELSGGQRQRVALARALVGRPELVIADEPTSMLDASLRAEILALIATIRRTHGTAFLFVTHDLAMARYVADRIAVLQAGRMVECGDTERLISSPTHPYTRELLAASESVR